MATMAKKKDLSGRIVDPKSAPDGVDWQGLRVAGEKWGDLLHPQKR